MTVPRITCTSCDGVLTYRVKSEGKEHSADNFDQLVDHQPRLFTSPMFLAAQVHGTGQITVEHFPNGWSEDAVGQVVAFAGPDPTTGDRTWRTASSQAVKS